MKYYLDLSVYVGSDDYIMFLEIMNDTRMKFSWGQVNNNRYYVFIHHSEIYALIDCLIDLEDDEADLWLYDIENLDLSQYAGFNEQRAV